MCIRDRTTDHPDIDTYFVLYEVVEGNKNTALEALYFMPWDPEQQPADLELLREELLRFDSVCNRIVERMPEEYSTYDKYRYLAAVISLITSYDYEFTWGWQTGTAYGSILGGHSICQGYSRGFLYPVSYTHLEIGRPSWLALTWVFHFPVL